MADFVIYGVDTNGSRTRIAHTPSARAAKAYRDRSEGPWEQILICSAEGELSVPELDRMAAIEDPTAKRF